MQLSRHCYCWAYARRALHSHWLGVCSACTLAASLGVCSTRHMAGWARCSAGQLGIGRCARPQKNFFCYRLQSSKILLPAAEMSTAAAAAATGTGFLSTFVWSPTQLVAVLIVCAGRAFRHGTPLLVAILGTHKQMNFTLYFKPVNSSSTTTTTSNSSYTISKAAVG